MTTESRPVSKVSKPIVSGRFAKLVRVKLPSRKERLGEEFTRPEPAPVPASKRGRITPRK